MLLILSLSASGLALVFTRSPVFGWARNLAARMGDVIGELARCYFCMGTWFSMALAALYPAPELIPESASRPWAINWLTASMAITALAGLFSGSAIVLLKLQNALADRE